MNKIEKQLKNYYKESLSHESRLNHAKAELDFALTPKRNSIRVKFLVSSLISVALVGGIAVSVVSLTNVNKNNDPFNVLVNPTKRLKNSVVTMDLNPTVTLLTDEDGNVSSLYGSNDDGKILVFDEDYVGKPIHIVMGNIIKEEVECGFFVTNHMSNSYNQLSVSIYSQNEFDGKGLKHGIEKYLNESNVQLDESSISINDEGDDISSLIEEVDDSNEIDTSDTSYEEGFNYLQSVYDEASEYSTKVVEEFYRTTDHYEELLSYYSTLDEECTSWGLKFQYDQALSSLEYNISKYTSWYFKNFIDESSTYQKNYQKLLDEKIDCLIYRTELAYLDNPSTSEVKELASKEAKVDASMMSLESLRTFLTSSIKTDIEDITSNLDSLSTMIKENADYEEIIDSHDFKDKYHEAFEHHKNEFRLEYRNNKEKIDTNTKSIKTKLKEGIARFIK